MPRRPRLKSHGVPLPGIGLQPEALPYDGEPRACLQRLRSWQPSITASTTSPRGSGVKRAFLWMFIRSSENH